MNRRFLQKMRPSSNTRSYDLPNGCTCEMVAFVSHLEVTSFQTRTLVPTGSGGLSEVAGGWAADSTVVSMVGKNLRMGRP